MIRVFKEIEMFNVRFVMHDSRVESYLVQAETEYQAINAVLNSFNLFKSVKQVCYCV
jgi:hypothetical protein